MGFLDYSNLTHSNIIPKDEFEGLTSEVFGVIAENICKSLGPLGSYATILDGMMTEATKDGFSILKKYCFHNRYKKMIYNLILAPCTKLNNTVGDGTTTVIALTNSMFARYRNMKNRLSVVYRLPRQFTQAWDEIIESICEYIESAATPVDPTDRDTIYHLAYVTSNGNEEISKAIADVYAESGSPSIKQKDSPTNKSYIEPIRGFDFPGNLISETFIKNQDLSVTEKDIAVMIFDHKIESDEFAQIIAPIDRVMVPMNKKLLVIAPYYDQHMCETDVTAYLMAELRQMGFVNLLMEQYEIGKLKSHQLEDLATVLRTKVITQDIANDMVAPLAENSDYAVDAFLNDTTAPLYRTIGECANAHMTCTNGSIFRVEDIESDEHYQEVLARARKELDDIKANTEDERQAYAAKIYDANARVLQLEMKNYIYYIGADSALQKQITWDAVEDVIKCLRSATKYGVVPGCQLTVVDACNQITKDLHEKYIPEGEDHTEEDLPPEVNLRAYILAIIYSAVLDVYSQILHGPEGQGMVKLLPRWQYTTEDGLEALRNEAVKKGQEIIDASIEKHQVFDMETLEYNPSIITSAETDIMVMRAASELVKILISGNQCIFLDSEINDSHQGEILM